MIVELYGLPGSGKSTLSRQISHDQNWRIVRIENRAEILRYNLLFLLRHPVKFLALFGYLVRGSSSRQMFKFKFLSFFLNRNAKYQKAKGYPLALIDEGHVQNIVSFFETPASETQLRRCLSFTPMPDLLVILKLTREELEAVVEGRDFTTRKERGSAYMSAWLEAIQANTETLLRIVPSLNTRHIIVDLRQQVNHDELLGLLSKLRETA